MSAKKFTAQTSRSADPLASRTTLDNASSSPLNEGNPTEQPGSDEARAVSPSGMSMAEKAKALFDSIQRRKVAEEGRRSTESSSSHNSLPPWVGRSQRYTSAGGTKRQRPRTVADQGHDEEEGEGDKEDGRARRRSGNDKRTGEQVNKRSKRSHDQREPALGTFAGPDIPDSKIPHMTSDAFLRALALDPNHGIDNAALHGMNESFRNRMVAPSLLISSIGEQRKVAEKIIEMGCGMSKGDIEATDENKIVLRDLYTSQKAISKVIKETVPVVDRLDAVLENFLNSLKK